jgi:SAM-dependent methyltransferase
MDEFMQPPAVAGDSVLQSTVLEGLSEAVNYRAWLASLALPWLGEDPVEVGSGIGDYAATWADLGLSILATEADPARLAHLRRRFDGDPRVRVAHLHAPITETARHSAVVAYNVLEHIADDVSALRAFGGLVTGGGHVVILVPAFPLGMSRFDREIGHYRRYRRAGLARAMSEADLDVVQMRYVNPVGLAAWIAGMRVLRRRPTPGLGLRAYDRMVPYLRRLESRRPPLFGQSLFAVARARA